ncbi:transposase [Streptomyces sp. NPDC090045]|uniref:transposase n=1 Tax=Streptomyces sp. NPDC090045 TaxID=3365927 RepID=UPI003823C6D5
MPVPAWLEGRGGRPEGYCHRVMLDAVRYVVDNGVKWANLPKDFPPYGRVSPFARRWQAAGLLAEFHDRLRERMRVKEGRGVDPTAAIVDSQSVRAATNVPRSTAGWDGGKKVGGRKRHLAVVQLCLVSRSDPTCPLNGFQVPSPWAGRTGQRPGAPLSCFTHNLHPCPPAQHQRLLGQVRITPGPPMPSGPRGSRRAPART